jgi:osmotically-inducible protein OsmY
MATSPAEVACRIFANSPYRAIQLLQCTFCNGELVIVGRVPSHYLKQLAQTAVKKVEGVTQIRNLIEVTL